MTVIRNKRHAGMKPTVLLLSLALILTACASTPTGSGAKEPYEIVRHLNNVEGPQAAIAKAKEFLAKQPNDYGVLYWMADAYRDSGDLSTAFKTYQRVANEASDPNWKAGSHIKLAAFLPPEEHQRALQHLDQAQRLRPLLGDPFIIRGRIYLNQGRYDEALAVFDNLLANPGVGKSYSYNKRFEGHRGKAYALLGLGKPDAALAELNRARAADSNWSPDDDVSVIYYIARNYEKPIAQPLALTVVPDSRLEKMQIRAAQQPAVQPLLTRRNTLQEIEKIEAGDGGRSALRRCVDYLDSVSSTALKMPVIEKCIQIARGLSPPPAIPEVALRHATRAETLLRLASNAQEIAEAMGEFESALNHAPWWADAWFNLGVAQRGAAQPGKAIDSFRLFLLAAPDDPAANQVQMELYALEIEAERHVKRANWTGQWAEFSGTIFEMRQTGDQIELIFTETDSVDSNLGFNKGDVKLTATVDGNLLRGKLSFRNSDEDVRRCFGNPFQEDVTGELSPDGYSLNLKWNSSSFVIRTCEVTRQTEKTKTYYRLP